ncbi:flagellar basal body protein FliL [Micromonospora sp. NEAU-HG-1]|nr:flagellar basal body protein FliL [Micromonospora rubida]
MSNYGPPGEGPTGPWPGRRPGDGYDPPGEAWAPDGYARSSGPQAGEGRGESQPAYPPRQPGRHEPSERAPHPADRTSWSDDPRRFTQPSGEPQPDPWDRPESWPHEPEVYRPGGGAPGYPAGRRPGDPYAAGPYPGPGPGQPAHFGAPTPPPRRGRGRGPLIAVLATLVVLLLGGGSLVWYLLDRDEAPEGAGQARPTADATPEEQPASPTAPAPTAAAPESSADPRFVKAGQCVRNTGPAGGKPKLLIASCAPKTYEVLRRFDGRTSGEKDAEAKCAKVTGYTNWYFFDSQLDTLDFVLCLKAR